ncbi:hypothetical protein ACH5RR_032910 [Cinchona calisaya]|uniref:Zinc finger, CCHC-type n=1 Tax=Cinchona calisaya TaxID=153742 RepID=A0ABD2YPS5_9GENT
MGFMTLREMAIDFVKLERFDGGKQKKMHFLLATLNMVYVLNPPNPMENDEETLANNRARQKWENDDYICRGHILNGMFEGLFDTYENVRIVGQIGERFDGGNFQKWQKKMHFLLATLNVVYVLNTPQPMENDEETLANNRARQKWENDDYICRGHILNGMSEGLFNTYQNVPSSRELWDKLEVRYMKKDATNVKRNVKHKKEELSLEDLANHLRLEEEMRKQDEK